MAAQHVQVAGGRIAYHREGSGEPVVLVHGITTYSFIWGDVARLLARGYDVIAIDLLGCGESDMPLDVSYAIQAHAERIPELLDSLGIQRCHFVGHDLGGGIAQILAVNHPERLIDIAMINPVGYDFWPVQPITALRTPIVRQLMMASFDFGTFKMVVKRGVYHKELVTAELIDTFMTPMSTAEGRKAFMHFARCLDNHNLTEISDALTRLEVPALIIRGDADPYLSALICERLHADIPGSRLVRIPTAGHFAMLDEPKTIADELLAHFERGHD